MLRFGPARRAPDDALLRAARGGWAQGPGEATGDAATRVRCEESMAGPLLVLFYSSAKLQTGMEQWLTALKTAAEQR